MAVTVSSRVAHLTAEGDELAYPLIVKTIRWVGATTAGHSLILTESSTGTTTKEIYESVAAGANTVEETLKEMTFTHGLRVGTLDSGEVWVYLK